MAQLARVAAGLVAAAVAEVPLQAEAVPARLGSLAAPDSLQVAPTGLQHSLVPLLAVHFHQVAGSADLAVLGPDSEAESAEQSPLQAHRWLDSARLLARQAAKSAATRGTRRRSGLPDFVDRLLRGRCSFAEQQFLEPAARP